MRLLEWLRGGQRPNSAELAKERLKIIIAHEHIEEHRAPDWLPRLKEELLEVVRRYVAVTDDAVRIERDASAEVLELNIVLPERN